MDILATSSTPTIDKALQWAEEALASKGIDKSTDARWLLEHCSDSSLSYLYARSNERLSEDQWRGYRLAIKRRGLGEPLAYICGHSHFRKLNIQVDKRVLIPRPETEYLVELALNDIPTTRPLRIADMGTGSGAIAISIAMERPNISVIATDNSKEALMVAKNNILRYGLEKRISLRCGSWCQAIQQEKDLAMIIANPPYIKSSEEILSKPPLNYEPSNALIAGTQGIDALESIIANAAKHLIPDGLIYLEHAGHQADWVIYKLREYGWNHARTKRDLEYRPLFTMARRGK